MTITLSHMETFELARRFAESVLYRVLEQHRILIDGGAFGELADRRLREVRSALRSIPDKYDRRDFIVAMRYWIKQIRAERGWEVRGRDYVAKVKAHRAAMREAA